LLPFLARSRALDYRAWCLRAVASSAGGGDVSELPLSKASGRAALMRAATW
jgi:hypothetical protein